MNQSHAAPDNQPTTIPHRCDHLSFLLQRSPSFPRTRSIQLSLGSFPLSSFLLVAPTILSFLYLSIFHFLSLSATAVLVPPPMHTYIVERSFARPATSLSLSLSLPPLFVTQSVSFALSLSLSLCRPRIFLLVTLTCFSSRSCFHEATEHRPILHLNLVNLPELANELWAWCLILAHEHGRRYTASNASGEGTRVYMCVCTVRGKSRGHAAGGKKVRGLHAAKRMRLRVEEATGGRHRSVCNPVYRGGLSRFLT